MHTIGRGICGNIEILGIQAQKLITDAATGQVCRVPGSAKGADDLYRPGAAFGGGTGHLCIELTHGKKCSERSAWRVLAGDIEELDATTQVRDDDGATDDEGDIEGLEELLIGDAAGNALIDVVGDAVVTTEDHGGDEAEKLFGLARKLAIFVAGAIETEEAFHIQRGADGCVISVSRWWRVRVCGSTEYPRIHAGAIGLKLLIAIKMIVR